MTVQHCTQHELATCPNHKDPSAHANHHRLRRYGHTHDASGSSACTLICCSLILGCCAAAAAGESHLASVQGTWTMHSVKPYGAATQALCGTQWAIFGWYNNATLHVSEEEESPEQHAEHAEEEHEEHHFVVSPDVCAYMDWESGQYADDHADEHDGEEAEPSMLYKKCGPFTITLEAVPHEEEPAGLEEEHGEDLHEGEDEHGHEHVRVLMINVSGPLDQVVYEGPPLAGEGGCLYEFEAPLIEEADALVPHKAEKASAQTWGFAMLAQTIASLVTLVGIILFLIWTKNSERVVFALLALSAGTLLGGALFSLLPETVEILGFGMDVAIVMMVGVIFGLLSQQVLHSHTHNQQKFSSDVSDEDKPDHDHEHPAERNLAISEMVRSESAQSMPEPSPLPDSSARPLHPTCDTLGPTCESLHTPTCPEHEPKNRFDDALRHIGRMAMTDGKEVIVHAPEPMTVTGTRAEIDHDHHDHHDHDHHDHHDHDHDHFDHDHDHFRTQAHSFAGHRNGEHVSSVSLAASSSPSSSERVMVHRAPFTHNALEVASPTNVTKPQEGESKKKHGTHKDRDQDHHHHAHHHHHHDEKSHAISKDLMLVNLLGDALHSFVDGGVIGAAFLEGNAVGLVVTIAIILHELPQELGDYALLLHSGLTPCRALQLNFLVSLTGFIGCGITLAIGGEIYQVSYILPFATGLFLYLALAGLVPLLINPTISHPPDSRLTFFYVLLGVVIMLLMALFLPHSHGHEEAAAAGADPHAGHGH
eukprot:g64454.t1